MSSVSTEFVGTATLTTSNRHARGPFRQDVKLTAVLDQADGAGAAVSDLAMASITTPPFSVKHPLRGQVDVITTVSLRGARAGIHEKATGRIEVEVDLHFDHRNVATERPLLGAGPSNATIRLTTDPDVHSPRGLLRADGAALDRQTGDVTLVGGSVFLGGFLKGSELMISICGRFDPAP